MLPSVIGGPACYLGFRITPVRPLIDHTTGALPSVHLRSRLPDLTALVAVLLKATERFG
jgi:hypothetical protein